jgi:hypothetical protein
MSYARIAELLLQKYKLGICRETIFKFVKGTSRGRKMYGYSRKRPRKQLRICSGNTTGRRSWFPYASRNYRAAVEKVSKISRFHG